jgi:hypothetical protein
MDLGWIRLAPAALRLHSRTAEDFMSLTTILLIVVVVILLGGGGYYWRR